MSFVPVRALSPGRVLTWRTAFLAFGLLLSTFALPPFLDLDSPLVPAGAVANQGNATECRAYGINWTSCQNAFARDDLYAYANASVIPSVIQRVATTTDSADASSWSFSHTVPAGSNRFLLLAVATNGGTAVSGTPQYGSTSFALIATLVHSTGSPRVTVYSLLAPTVGTALVTGNLAIADRYTVGTVSYTGVHQTTPADNLTTGQGAAGNQITITVPSEVGDLVVDYTANIGAGAPNVGSGQTEIYNEEMGGLGATNHYATSSEEAGASSVVMRWNGKENGKEWVSVGLNLNRAPPAVGAAVRDTAWRGFGFALDPADEVQVVEVGVEWWRNNTAPLLNVTVSWDGGTTWATNQTATNKSADDDTVEWLDFTSATAWNASTLRDSNLRVRVGTDFAGARLDYVTVRTTYNDAPEVSNLRIEDAVGQSLAGGLLDPGAAYHFLFNVTDEDGWVDIGTDGDVALQMWYDGNVTPEISFAEQTNGSNYRIELRYEDLADPGNATLDEWSVVEGNAAYNASASLLTPILNGTTLIGYEFNLSVSLGLFVKAASKPTNSTPGAYNDPDSWNVEALAFDGSVGDRQPRAASGEHMEFGVFDVALMGYAAAASPTTLQPGDTTVLRVDFDNTGQGPASRVWVNVTFPADLTYVSDDAATIGGVRTCCQSFEFTDVDPGIYVFNVTASASGGGANGTVAVMNVTYQALDATARPINQTAEDVSVTIVNAVMSYGASVSPTTLQPGDTTTFRVDFANSGQGDAGSVWINVTLPADLTYVSDDAALIGGVVLCCHDYSFTNGSPGTYAFNVTALANGGVANGTVGTTNFTFEAADPGGVPLPSSAQDVAVTLANAALTLVVTASFSVAEPGDSLTFTATVTNSGALSAESLVIEGSVDANATYVSSSLGGTYDGPARLVRWNLASLAPGTQAAFQWTVTVNTNVRDGATVTARAKADSRDTSGTPLPSLEDSIQADVVSASFAPVLVVIPLDAEREDEVFASLYYNNTGAGTSGTVWINWTLNGHYELVALIPEPLFTTTADGFDVVLSSVASGTQRLDARLRVIRGLQDSLAMGIGVSFASTHRNGNPLDAADLQASVSLKAPAVALTLATGLAAVDAGAAFTLDVTITNSGQAAAVGWLNLTLPAGVAFRGDDGTFAVTETADGVSWVLASVPAGAAINLVVTLTAESELGLQSFRFAMDFTDGKGSPPMSVISNAVSVQIGPGASTPPVPWTWLLLAALAGGIALFLLTRRLRRPSIEEVLVVHKNGVLIAHRSKTLTPDRDEDILAAMLGTVQSFIRDAFTEHEDTPVRGLQFDKFNILVEQGTHHYVAVVFRGKDNGTLQARLHHLSDRIEAEFREVLAEWSGVSSDVRPVKALLPLLWGKRIAREKKAPENAAAVIEEPTETVVQVDEGGAASEITRDAVRKARKSDLRAWCLQFGLSDSGSGADLRERLLHHLGATEEDMVQELESEPRPAETPPDNAPEEPGTKEPGDEAESIEEEIESMSESAEVEPEDSPWEVPEAIPEDPPEGEIRTPVIVPGDPAEPGEDENKREEATKRKKERRRKKDKKIRSGTALEETAAEASVEEKEEKKLEEPPEVENELVGESAPAAKEATGGSPELTVKMIWDAPNTQLREWCQQLGLDDAGPLMNLRLRLLGHFE